MQNQLISQKALEVAERLIAFQRYQSRESIHTNNLQTLRSYVSDSINNHENVDLEPLRCALSGSDIVIKGADKYISLASDGTEKWELAVSFPEFTLMASWDFCPVPNEAGYSRSLLLWVASDLLSEGQRIAIQDAFEEGINDFASSPTDGRLTDTPTQQPDIGHYQFTQAVRFLEVFGIECDYYEVTLDILTNESDTHKHSMLVQADNDIQAMVYGTLAYAGGVNQLSVEGDYYRNNANDYIIRSIDMKYLSQWDFELRSKALTIFNKFDLPTYKISQVGCLQLTVEPYLYPSVSGMAYTSSRDAKGQYFVDLTLVTEGADNLARFLNVDLDELVERLVWVNNVSENDTVTVSAVTVPHVLFTYLTHGDATLFPNEDLAVVSIPPEDDRFEVAKQTLEGFHGEGLLLLRDGSRIG